MFSAHAVTRRRTQLAPYFFMEDTNPNERRLTISFNRVSLSKSEAISLYTARVPAGMRAEIERAHRLGIPIKYFDADS